MTRLPLLFALSLTALTLPQCSDDPFEREELLGAWVSVQTLSGVYTDDADTTFDTTGFHETPPDSAQYGASISEREFVLYYLNAPENNCWSHTRWLFNVQDGVIPLYSTTAGDYSFWMDGDTLVLGFLLTSTQTRFKHYSFVNRNVTFPLPHWPDSACVY